MYRLASLLVLLAGLSFGQAGLTLACPTNVKAGTALTCTLSLSGATNPAALQFTMVTPVQVTGSTVILAAGLAAKSASCATICLIYGGITPIADGQIATVAFQTGKTATGTFQVGINASVVASPTATLIASTVNPSVPVSSSSPCDITGDGQMNAADIAMMVSEIQKNQTVDDLNSDSKVDAVDLQMEIIAVSSGVCNAK